MHPIAVANLLRANADVSCHFAEAAARELREREVLSEV